MAKLAFTKLGLKTNTDIETLEFNEQTIEIKQYLPVNDKLTLISEVINNSADENNFANPVKVEVYVTIAIIEAYTNITFTDKQKEDIPKLGKFRGDKNSSAYFFGPFPSGLAVNESIKMIQSVFGLRTCKDTMFHNRQTPCLLYQIKKCSGVCCGKITPAEYKRNVDDAISFLNGENRDVIDNLSNASGL